MARRLELQTTLETLLGSRNVYYQPTENIRIQYPAIVYTRDNIESLYGDNIPYLHNFRYSVTHIDRNPDSEVVMKLANLPKSSFAQSFVADNLHHNVFRLYY